MPIYNPKIFHILMLMLHLLQLVGQPNQRPSSSFIRTFPMSCYFSKGSVIFELHCLWVYRRCTNETKYENLSDCPKHGSNPSPSPPTYQSSDHWAIENGGYIIHQKLLDYVLKLWPYLASLRFNSLNFTFVSSSLFHFCIFLLISLYYFTLSNLSYYFHNHTKCKRISVI